MAHTDSTPDRPPRTYAVPAIDKAFDLLELLADNPDGLTLTEIAARLGRSIGELFRIAVVLERRGLLRKHPETDRLSVAYALLNLAYRATPAQHVTQAAAPVMQRLAAAVGQSCHLVVLNGGNGLVIAREENPGTRGFSVRLGATVDLARSCSGHVLLAFSEPAQVQAILARLPRARAAPLDRKDLSTKLAAVAGRGFDRRPSPITHGVTDISYPVRGFDGRVIAALTIPFLELIDGSQPVDLDAAQAQLATAALDVSERLGWHDRGSPGRPAS